MYESCYYKDDLLRYAKDFEKRSKRQLYREDSLAKAEKQLFIGMLFIRKLIESLKITDSCKRSSISILRGKISPRNEISNFSRHDIMDYLSEANWSEVKVGIEQVCDKVIHSWVNYPIINKSGGLQSFILTTDRYKNKELWEVPVTSIISAFCRFGSDYPSEITMSRDENGKINYQCIK